MHVTATITGQLFVGSLHATFSALISVKGNYCGLFSSHLKQILQNTYNTVCCKRGPVSKLHSIHSVGEIKTSKWAATESYLSMYRATLPNFPITWVSSEKVQPFNPVPGRDEDNSCRHSHIICSTKSSLE